MEMHTLKYTHTHAVAQLCSKKREYDFHITKEWFDF